VPDVDRAGHELIVDRLVGGLHAHDYAITARRHKGRRVRDADAQEEALLWTMLRQCDTHVEVDTDHRRVLTVRAGEDFLARRVQVQGPPDAGPDLRWRTG
jgi:hypothetical protein